MSNPLHTSPYTLAQIEAAVAQAFPQARLCQVINESAAHAGHTGNPNGDALSHIRIILRCPSLASLRPVVQHRQVHAALSPFYALGLHAVVLDTAA